MLNRVQHNMRQELRGLLRLVDTHQYAAYT